MLGFGAGGASTWITGGASRTVHHRRRNRHRRLHDRRRRHHGGRLELLLGRRGRRLLRRGRRLFLDIERLKVFSDLLDYIICEPGNKCVPYQGMEQSATAAIATILRELID